METKTSAPKISAPQHSPDRNIFRYGLALGSVALAVGVALLAWRYNIRHIEFTVLLFAIAVTAWYGGLGAAMLAVVLSSLAFAYFFAPPIYSFAVSREELPHYVLFVLFALLVGWFGAVRRRVEAQLRASEQKYRGLIDASPDAIFVWNEDGRCVLANASAARLCGCAEKELLGTHFGESHAPDERELVLQRRAQAKDSVARFESQFVRKNKELIPVEVSLSIAGETQYQAVIRDISDRKKAEEELRKRAELLNLAPDAIIVRDPESRITFWNPGAETTYGWTAANAMGKVTHELLQTTFPKPLDQINAMLLRTGRWQGELIHTKCDGARVVVASRWSLRRDEHGTPAAILEINRDVTDRKRAEEQIRKLNEELEQRVIERTRELEVVNKELEAFAYSVSHDLRAPVRHITGFAEVLQTSAASLLDEKSQHNVNMIRDSAKRMGQLIDDLLAFSQTGRAEAHLTDINLDQVVQEALAEVAPDAQGREIVWQLGTLPACHGDRSLLRLVFINLISNALKFTRTRAKAEIEIGCLNHWPNQVVVFVKDNGVGFDPKYKEKLFGVFKRLHSQETFEGTGIGLATVQRIVHRHGGQVWADAALEKGATFYVALPKTP